VKRFSTSPVINEQVVLLRFKHSGLLH